MSGKPVKHWKPMDIFESDSTAKFALLILNQTMEGQLDMLLKLWERAVVRATVDGGTNHWHDLLTHHGINLNNYVPDLITGDFDSVNAGILQHYERMGSKVVPTPDQDSTDFSKGVQVVMTSAQQGANDLDYIIAVANTTGRIDQILANINTLYLTENWIRPPIYLLSRESLTWLLHDKFKHSIMIKQQMMNDWCGLIPIGEPCANVTTTGLKWNLQGQRLQFGHLISTSNTYDRSGLVTIDADKPLLWCMGLMM